MKQLIAYLTSILVVVLIGLTLQASATVTPVEKH